jgi:hypothetical protein
MTTTSDVLGPVDWLVVEFPADKANFSGEMARELQALVDRELSASWTSSSSARTRTARSMSTS